MVTACSQDQKCKEKNGECQSQGMDCDGPTVDDDCSGDMCTCCLPSNREYET